MIKVLIKFIAGFLCVFIAFILVSDIFSSPAISGESTYLPDTETNLNSYEDLDVLKRIFESYQEQKAQGIQLKGWLYVPNICYYPVMYSADNEFYLDHGPDKLPSIYGALFFDYTFGTNAEDVLVVHGHHMYDGTMFSKLNKYLVEDFYLNNKSIIYFDGLNFYFYKPYNADTFDAYEIPFPENNMDLSARTKFIDDMILNSPIKFAEISENLDYGAPLITLSTCDYSFHDARMVVFGISVDKMSLTSFKKLSQNS